MNSFEAAAAVPSSSNTVFSSVENNCEASTSSSTRAVDTIGPPEFSFDLVIGYIDDVLYVVTNKSLRSKMLDSGMKLKDMLEPIASDFSKLCEAISQGAKMFSDQKSWTNSLFSEAHTVALDVLKGVGNAHWAAVGLLAIANVLERLDKISTNDRECIDLLKGMLDLAKFIKMLKDINADFHKEILTKMSEALHLIVSGAILCHSFIRCNKISKFLLTKKICEELVYVRGKVDRMKTDIGLQMNYMIVSSITLHLSRQNHHHHDDEKLQRQRTNDAGGTEETNFLIEEFPSEQPNHVHGGMAQRSETEISTVASKLEYVTQEIHSPESSNQGNMIHNSNKNKWYQLRQMLPRTLFTFGRYLKYTAIGLRHKFQGCQKPGRQVPSDLRMALDDNQLSTFARQQGFGWIPIRFTIQELETATNSFQELLGKGGFGDAYRGTLYNGRQVVIKRSRNRRGELLKELVCISNLRHRNIVNLFGFCITGVELLLVFDYMPNGTLSKFLFNPTESEVLDWPTRWKIIQGLIGAVVYLHESVDVSIVHRDIKPTNILLDENFNAKLADFGIARTLHNNKSAPIGGIYEGMTTLDINSDCSTAAAGTMGYIAPECIATGHVTKKADIFSFGLLVLNVISGKRCLQFTSVDDGMFSLMEQAFTFHREDRLMELLDPELVKSGGFEWTEMLRIILTSLWCIQTDPNLRPSASRAWVMLSTEVEIPSPPEQWVNHVYSSLLERSASVERSASAASNSPDSTATFGR